MEYPDIFLLIGGERRTSRDAIDVINPADEAAIGRVPIATAHDLDDAVAAAAKSFAVWRRMSPTARSKIILKAVGLLRERSEAIAYAMTLEQGKTLAESRLEITRGCEILEWDANEGRRTYGRVIPSEFGTRILVTREPIGVVAAFSPWNFPFSSPARKIGAALASGCALILKASEETPAAAYMLTQAFQDAGLPHGVLNLVFGNPAEISARLIANPSVRLVTLTGPVAVGKKLAALSGQYMKPVVMELGGHAPTIVCSDVNPAKAAEAALMGKSRNAGQVCVSPTRFYVHESIFDEFVTRFAEGAQALKIGSGLDPSNNMGALANPRRMDAMESLIGEAVQRGATVAAGGGRLGNQGFFHNLTVLADVPDAARAMQEEPFGPLALVNRFHRLEDAIQRANGLPFGLAAYAFTNDATAAQILSEELECGNLAINHYTASWAETPFGGVKDSGYGREGGVEGLESYTVAKLTSHRNLN